MLSLETNYPNAYVYKNRPIYGSLRNNLSLNYISYYGNPNHNKTDMSHPIMFTPQNPQRGSLCALFLPLLFIFFLFPQRFSLIFVYILSVRHILFLRYLRKKLRKGSLRMRDAIYALVLLIHSGSFAEDITWTDLMMIKYTE